VNHNNLHVDRILGRRVEKEITGKPQIWTGVKIRNVSQVASTFAPQKQNVRFRRVASAPIQPGIGVAWRLQPTLEWDSERKTGFHAPQGHNPWSQCGTREKRATNGGQKSTTHAPVYRIRALLTLNTGTLEHSLPCLPRRGAVLEEPLPCLSPNASILERALPHFSTRPLDTGTTALLVWLTRCRYWNERSPI
jgi:hypothetical protein